MKNTIPQSSGIFRSMDEYRNLLILLKESNDWYEVSVSTPINNVGFQENWFSCISSSQTWRIVMPDAPFEGLWEEVK